ncbi:MAG TPA: CDP-alcohol phosphatidyltransferase family protein, partial [Bacteroidia bacterium]|nr:CDP-alcohol phosphatidyltransferase family protein [Bacteroidia bacterium]
IVFKTSVLGNDMLWLYFFLGMWLSGILLSLIRFGKFPTLHLYSAKISGYLQGIFFFILFSYGYSRGLFFTAIVWAILSGIEEMWVLLSLKELRSDVKGIWWLKKENKKSRMD